MLELLAGGLPPGEIAYRLSRSDETVHNPIAAVLTELPVPTAWR